MSCSFRAVRSFSKTPGLRRVFEQCEDLKIPLVIVGGGDHEDQINAGAVQRLVRKGARKPRGRSHLPG